jgi:hypothetical protein
VAQQEDRLRVAQLARNKNRKRWWQRLGGSELPAMKANETACAPGSDPFFQAR